MAIEGFGVVGVELATWVGFEGPSPWVDCLSPLGATNSGSNSGFGQSYWAIVKGRGYLNFVRVRWDIVS
jgi:hypothetical protein